MAELVVCGPEPMQRWRRAIPPGEIIRLGRAPRSGWAVPWDALISREHAELQMISGQLRVRRLDASRNPNLFSGGRIFDFLVTPGEQFRIGRTLFQMVSADLDTDSKSPASERSFHPDELRKVAFQNADQRLKCCRSCRRQSRRRQPTKTSRVAWRASCWKQFRRPRLPPSWPSTSSAVMLNRE